MHSARDTCGAAVAHGTWHVARRSAIYIQQSKATRCTQERERDPSQLSDLVMFPPGKTETKGSWCFAVCGLWLRMVCMREEE